MITSVQIDGIKLAEAAADEARKMLGRKAHEAGAVVVSQTRRRFDRRGDETLRWPDLWASDDKAVRQTVRRESGSLDRIIARKIVREQVEAARKAERKVEDNIRGGKYKTLRKAKGRLRTVRAVRRYWEDAQRNGNWHYRKGGQPLVDTGALRDSIDYTIDEDGDSVVIGIGTPLIYGVYHQNGFTTKGPNYIPITAEARRKPPNATPQEMGLIYGFDYIYIKGGVTVPARPFARFTPTDLADIRETIEEQ